MTSIRKMRIHRFGGPEVLQLDQVETSLPDASQGVVRHGRLNAGQSVLIHGGSGGVGHFAIQFAKAKGARVLTTVSTGNVELARKLGADVVIDYKSQRLEHFASGLDMVFDLI